MDEMKRPVVRTTPPVLRHAGAFEFKMMARTVGEDHGGTLEVYGEADGTRHELLKFDCFAMNTHWHRCYPGRKDEVAQLEPPGKERGLGFAMETLRDRFAPLIADQGFASLAPAVADRAVQGTLVEVEAIMRDLIERDPASIAAGALPVP
jgi:hypothetical protein